MIIHNLTFRARITRGSKTIDREVTVRDMRFMLGIEEPTQEWEQEWINGFPPGWFGSDSLRVRVGPRVSYINKAEGYSELATSMYVDHPERFEEGDIVLVPRTRESMIVEGRSGEVLCVYRGFRSRPTSLVDDDTLCIIGSTTHEEHWKPAPHDP